MIRVLKWIAVGGFIFAIVTIFYFPNYAKLKRLKQANEELLSTINVLEREIGDLQEKLQKVSQDSHLYEKVARDDLGVAKEGEIVIDIEE